MSQPRPTGSRRLVAIGFLVVLMTAGLLGGVRYGNGFVGAFRLPLNPAPEGGSSALDFELVTLTGEPARLSSLFGKPVLINFGATWCTPCIFEMQGLQKYYESYEGQFEVFAINAGESEWEIQRFV